MILQSHVTKSDKKLIIVIITIIIINQCLFIVLLSESSTEIESTSIPSKQTISESKIDLPHQTTTDQGLHNPQLYVNICVYI